MKNVTSTNGVGATPKRSGLRTWLLTLFSLALIGAFIYYLYANTDKYLSLLRLSPLPLALIFMLSLTTPFLNGSINTLMYRGLGTDLSRQEGFLLAAASSLANQLPVSGGVVTKAYYLKRMHGLSYTKYISSMLAIFFCTIATYGLLGLTILISWVLLDNMRVSPVLWVGFGGMALGALIFWLPLERLHIPGTLTTWIQQAMEGWTLISQNPVLIVKLLAVQTTMMSLLAVRYWLAFHMLSQSVSIGQVILFSSGSILTNLVSFAPGGLGVREAIVAGIASALGFDAGTSVVAVGLDRLVSTLVIMLVGWISTVLLGKKIAEGPAETVELER